MAESARILAIGTFDIPHMGHATFLKKASALGLVTVGVLGDSFVRLAKGEFPLYNENERYMAVTRLGYPVLLINGDLESMTHPLDNTLARQFNYLAVGSDWMGQYHKRLGMSANELTDLGVGIIYIPYTEGISTTDIKERLRERSNSG